MTIPKNPFNEIYVTETIGSDAFVGLFSPVLVTGCTDVHPLFQSGNVILAGVQGSGKSMLLALLIPEIRVAYAKAGQDFPVPEAYARFVTAGINLTRSGVNDFGQRDVSASPHGSPNLAASCFADFLNYWIVRDLLKSVCVLSAEPSLRNDLELDTPEGKLDEFSRALATCGCWGGYLDDVRNYRDLQARIDERIKGYRDFLNYNRDDLPEELQRTKTSPGEPISRTARQLRESGVVPENMPVYVRIDQYEVLFHLEKWHKSREQYRAFSSVIHKMLGTRDPSISYRIGARKYALSSQEESGMLGTTEAVEELRNYKRVDIDKIFRRTEHTKNWLFRRFSRDIFARRLENAGYQISDASQSILRTVLTRKLSPREKASRYARKSHEAVIKLPDECPPEASTAVLELAETDVLSAKLGEAWIRQQLGRNEPDAVLPTAGNFPWESKEKEWWKKERIQQALLQIAASRRQRMLWIGENDVLGLSGGNVLAFLSICQHIWDAWLRSIAPEDLADVASLPPTIDNPNIQTEGIEKTSAEWYRKVRHDPGGDTRRRFLDCLGEYLRDKLRKDDSMSYPGSNGFSVSKKELDTYPSVRRYLEEAANYGVLIELPHTHKNPGQGRRTKWYLSPILCPYFQIPYARTKEPVYLRVGNIRRWLEEAEVVLSPPLPAMGDSEEDDTQMRLFDEPEGPQSQ